MANEQRMISVDANKLEELLSECFDVVKCIKPTELSLMHALLVWKGICKQPTVDAVEVVHGRWIPLEYDGYADGNPVWNLWECSECQEEHSGDEDTLTPYCPNCGAKMDGGNDNA